MRPGIREFDALGAGTHPLRLPAVPIGIDRKPQEKSPSVSRYPKSQFICWPASRSSINTSTVCPIASVAGGVERCRQAMLLCVGADQHFNRGSHGAMFSRCRKSQQLLDVRGRADSHGLILQSFHSRFAKAFLCRKCTALLRKDRSRRLLSTGHETRALQCMSRISWHWFRPASPNITFIFNCLRYCRRRWPGSASRSRRRLCRGDETRELGRCHAEAVSVRLLSG